MKLSENRRMLGLREIRDGEMLRGHRPSGFGGRTTPSMKTTTSIMSFRKYFSFGRMMAGGLAAAACLAATVSSVQAGPVTAPAAFEEPAAADEWQFGMGIYGWAPAMEGTMFNGQSFKMEFDQILDNLNMTAMVVFEARKGNWFFGSDVIYMDMGTDIYTPALRGLVRTSIDLKSWIVTPMGGYTVMEGDWGRLDVLGGVRYFYMKTQLGVNGTFPLVTPSTYITGSADSWAGIVGIRGEVNLSGNWYMPYHLDIGTGDPDFTWQAFLGVGYRFQNFDVMLGYRYLDWEFQSSSLISDLDVSGPIFGAKFAF